MARRTFSRAPRVAAFACCLFAVAALAGAPSSSSSAPGWKLAVQAYTFNHFTFFEAIEKAKAAGVELIEAYPGQMLSKEDKVPFDHNAPLSVLAKTKLKLEKEGVRLVNYGVVGLSRDEKEDRKVFDFAKVMGIETIVAEPSRDAFDLLDRLTEEYGINVALHNHPKPSPYWSPDIVLEAVKGHSKRIGSCADIGHWMRSGIEPLEAVKKLEGRIISSHFKDLNEMGSGGYDMVWGTGKGKVKEVLTELHRQGFHGVFSIEYEHNWDNSLPDVTACARFFQATTAELAK
jgi:sugar phosphate isomerase/epimerase